MKKNVAIRSVMLGGLMIGLSLFATMTLIKLNKPPAEASTPPDVRSLTVRAIEVMPEDVTVHLKGFGEARTKHTVTLSTEIPGRVVYVHPELDMGNVIDEGELLFSIDASMYVMAREEIVAQLEGLKTTIRKHQMEEKHAQARYETLKRTHELSKLQLERSMRLLKNAIGNQTAVEESEEKVNIALNALKAVERELAVYPIRIEEVEQSILADEARLKRSELNIARAKVSAPFHGRVKMTDVEEGQYLNEFFDAVTLANDSILEIPIKLDARNAQQWIQFEEGATGSNLSWFDSVGQVPCEIRWTENDTSATWKGVLDRVEEFDPQSRTLTVVVQYRLEDGVSQDDDAFPLVAGMFCEVSIPGRKMEGVFALPHGAVGLDEEVYLSRDDRLRAVPVTVARVEGDTAYISEGLSSGDIVVVTRLVNPLNNSLLEVTLASDEASSTDSNL